MEGMPIRQRWFTQHTQAQHCKAMTQCIIKRFFTFFMIINMIFGVCTHAHADNASTPTSAVIVDAAPNDASPEVAPVKKGQPAPFDGTLLSPEAVATVVADRQATTETTKAETTRVQSEEQAKCKFTVDEAKASADAKLTVTDANLGAEKKKAVALNIALKKEIASRPNVAVWTVMGGIVGAGVTVLIVVALGKLPKL
jgi:hypothetical protein